MPETQEIEVFRFEELSDTNGGGYGSSPKDRARDWYREGFSEIIVDGVSDTFATELELRGLDGLEASWSLSYSQGDGVAFTGTVDLTEIKAVEQGGDDRPDQELDERHIAAIRAALHDLGVELGETLDPDQIEVRVESHNSHYTHYNSFRVDCDVHVDFDDESFIWGPSHDAALERLQDAVLDWLQDLSRQFEKAGYAEIEYQESDEQIEESCDANGYLFDRTGRPIHHLLPQEVK